MAFPTFVAEPLALAGFLLNRQHHGQAQQLHRAPQPVRAYQNSKGAQTGANDRPGGRRRLKIGSRSVRERLARCAKCWAGRFGVIRDGLGALLIRAAQQNKLVRRLRLVTICACLCRALSFALVPHLPLHLRPYGRGRGFGTGFSRPAAGRFARPADFYCRNCPRSADPWRPRGGGAGPGRCRCLLRALTIAGSVLKWLSSGCSGGPCWPGPPRRGRCSPRNLSPQPVPSRLSVLPSSAVLFDLSFRSPATAFVGNHTRRSGWMRCAGAGLRFTVRPSCLSNPTYQVCWPETCGLHSRSWPTAGACRLLRR